MPTLTSLKLKNIVLFKKATLPLDRTGVTVIRGLNKDADKRAEDVTNAAGKSLLVSAIAQVIRDSDPVSTDIKGVKSKAKGDFFTNRDSSITLEVENKGTNYSIEKTAKKYTLLENGEDTNTRGNRYAEEKLQALFNYSDEEFYTLYYISSSRPNTLQYGSSTERLAFFTKLFKLNNYDTYRKIFNGMLSNLKHDVIVLDEVKNDIVDCKADIQDLDYEYLSTTLANLTEKQNSYNSKLHDLYNKRNKLASIKANQQNYTNFNKLYRKISKVGIQYDVSNSESLVDSLDEARVLLNRYESKYEQQKKYEHYRSLKTAYETDQKKYLDKLTKYETDFTEDDADSFRQIELDVATLKGKLAQVDVRVPKRHLNDLDLTSIQRRFLKYTGHELKLGETDIEKVQEEFDAGMGSNLTKAAMARKALYDFNKLNGCNSCPTCLQELNNEGTKQIRKYLEARVSKYDDRLRKDEKIVDAITDAQDYIKISADLDKVEKIKLARELIQAGIDKLEVKREKLLPEYENFVAYSKYLKAYKVFQQRILEPVKKPTMPFSEDVYNMLRDWVNLSNNILPVYDDMVTSTTLDIDYDLDQVQESIDKLSSKLQKYSTSVPEISSKLSIYETTQKKLKSLRKRRAELQQSADDVPVLEKLIAAYSNKGIKLMVISRIAKIIENNMNKFSQLLYKERVKFRFEVTENSFNVYKEYTHNGVARSVDIRRLSGAQSRCFSFLLPLSIIPLIPVKKRLNIMILDEPVTNLDYSTRKLFTDNFIPKLNSVVPHLIIVTPLDDNYKNQKVYTVVKEGGWSKLVSS